MEATEPSSTEGPIDHTASGNGSPGADPIAPAGGRFLNGSQLLAELNTLFQSGTTDPEQRRAVGYDLRIGTTFMIVPVGRPGKRSQRQYRPDSEERCRRLLLHPGEVAFVSTEEHFTLDNQTGGMLAVKPGAAREGLLVSTGHWVDPGFGSDTPQRLFFQVGNVSDQEISLQPGRTSLITFLPIRFDAPQERPSSRSLTSEAEVADAFFSDSDELRSLALLGRFEELVEEQDKLRKRMDDEHESRNVVTFGVYLLGVSLFAVALTVFLSWGGSSSVADRISNISKHLPQSSGSKWLLAVIVIALAACFIALLRFAGDLAEYVIRRRRRRRV